MNKQGRYMGYGRKVEDNFPMRDRDKEDEIFDTMFEAADTLASTHLNFRNIIVIGITDDDDLPSIVTAKEYDNLDYLEGSVALTTRVHNSLIDDEDDDYDDDEEDWED